jgi:hypothetical protein
VQFECERGYLVIAQNTDSVDYVACARMLARSLRRVEPDAKICLLTDHNHSNLADFDHVRFFPFGDHSGDSDWKLHNDWQCFYATPFRQTIKIEADIIVPHSIAHWFDICQTRDVVLTLGARNWRNELSSCRYYRKVFDDNNLPDVYNAITYWRFSRDAELFFATVKEIMTNWSTVLSSLKFAADQPVNTDLAYAVAAKLLGPEKFMLPISVPSMIHLKPKFNDLVSDSWQRELIWEILPEDIRINTVSQMWPIHYQEKDFVHELEKYYG